MNIEKYKGQLSLSMRPHGLKDLHGCDQFKKAVLNYQKTGEWPTATLLQGRFGSGKTTAALIMAQMMNCKSPNENGDPCGECASCKSIVSNTFNNDVLFIDAAMASTAEEIESLGIEDFIKMPSMSGNHKVIIVDEFQQLARSAKANKMFLKLCETNRKKVHLIFTSMDNVSHKKEFEAVVSRCQTFYFGNKSTVDDMMYFLKETLERLGLWENRVNSSFQDDDTLFEWLQHLAMYSKGSYRQAIQNLQAALERDIFDIPTLQTEFGGASASQHKAIMDLMNGNFTSPDFNSVFFAESDDESSDDTSKLSQGLLFSYAYIEIADALYYKTTGRLPPKYDTQKYRAARFFREKEIPEVANHKCFNLVRESFKEISSMRRTYLGKADYMVAMCELMTKIKGALATPAGVSGIPTRKAKSAV